MTEVEALSVLSSMVAAESEPALPAAEVEQLLYLARRVDSEGVAPSETGWGGAWDFNSAAAEGWRRKAGKVAGAYTFTTDAQTFQRAQIYAHCLKQAEMYSRRVIGTYTVNASATTEGAVIGNLG